MGLYTVVSLIQKVFDIYGWLIVAWCLMTWIPTRSGSLFDDIRGAVGMLVEPYLNLFRRFIPPIMNVDWSPVVALFVLRIVERLLYAILL